MESFGLAQDRLRDTRHSERWVSALRASTHPTILRAPFDFAQDMLRVLRGENIFTVNLEESEIFATASFFL